MSVSVARDGKRLAVAHQGVVTVWSLETDSVVFEHILPSTRTKRGSAGSYVAFTPSGVVVAASGNTLTLWEAGASRAIAAKFNASTSAITSLLVMTDTHAITGHLDGVLRRWDLARGVAMRETLKGHRNSVPTLALEDDGRVLSAGLDRTVRRWDLANGTSEVVLDQLPAFPLAIDGGRGLVAVGSAALSLAILTLDGQRRLLPGHDDAPKWLSVLPGGRLATASDKLRIHDLATGECVQVIDTRGPIACVGETVISLPGAVHRWPLGVRSDEPEPVEIRARHADYVYAACATDTGFATCSGDATIKLWSADGAFVTSLRAHSHTVSVVRGLSGDRIVSGGFDRRVLLWDLRRREVIRTFDGCSEWVVALAVSADERRIATIERLGALRVWDLETGNVIARAKIDDESPLPALSPDGSTVFVGRRDGRIDVWSVSTRAKVTELASDARVRDLAIEPVTKRLVAITDVVRSWTLDGFVPGPALRDHRASIVGLSTGEGFAATGDSDGTVLYWDLEKGPVGSRRRHAPVGASTFAGKPDGSFVFGASSGEVLIVPSL